MSKKIMSKGGGIGESRIHRDPEAQPTDFLESLRGLHFNGTPAEEIEESALRYLRPALSDEHQAELTGKIEVHERGGSRPRARTQASEVEKHIQEREDWEGDMAEAPDVRRDLVEQHVAPGMRGKFVAERHLARTGRDHRGFEVVKDEQGQPVRHGTSILAQIPEERARGKNRRAEQASRDKVSQVYARADDSPQSRMTPERMLETAPDRK